ncbi:hypothetical protein CAK82_30190 (plasmid) [Klebsiella pneumoniae]|nr:hypothetical protein CAK82_30190 [Klebsiella pneumoniae]
MFHVFAGVQLATLIMPRSASTDNGFASLPRWTIAWQFGRHCCKVSDEAAFCLIQRPYISKTLLTRRISPRGSP